MKCASFPRIMKATALLTAGLTAGFALLYGLFARGWLLSCAITFGTTAYHFIMRLIVGAVIPNTFDYRHKWFQPRFWEASLYSKLQLKRWKANIPTYDPTLFSLTHYTLEQVVTHMCQAEVVHEVIVLLSFLPLLLTFVFGSFGVFFITSLLAAALDTVFILLQRYNRPRIIRLLQKRAATQPQKEFQK